MPLALDETSSLPGSELPHLCMKELGHDQKSMTYTVKELGDTKFYMFEGNYSSQQIPGYIYNPK